MAERAPDFLKGRALPSGMVRHIVTVQPATSFEYRYESSTGTARVIHLERGALEPQGSQPEELFSFRAGVSPGETPTRGGFFTSPDSVNLRAEGHILIEGGVSGDSIICQSLGSYAGLTVSLTIFRENSDGSIEQILQEQMRDALEHTFAIP
jgi:hypothetical protein